MSDNTTSIVTLVQDSGADKNPLILGSVGVGLGGLALLFIAFKNFAPASLTYSPFFKKVSGMFGSIASKIETKVKKDMHDTVEKVVKDPSSVAETVKQSVVTSLNEVSVEVCNSAGIQVDHQAQLADIKAMLQLLVNKSTVVQESPTGPTEPVLPGAMYATI